MKIFFPSIFSRVLETWRNRLYILAIEPASCSISERISRRVSDSHICEVSPFIIYGNKDNISFTDGAGKNKLIGVPLMLGKCRKAESKRRGVMVALYAVIYSLQEAYSSLMARRSRSVHRASVPRHLSESTS